MAQRPVIGPLPTGVPIDLESKESKALATFFALAIAARVAPTTLGPIARVGLGVEISTGAGIGTLTPFGITNFLPQPLGFVPPAQFGLAPNFYLPGEVGAGLPSFIPGAAEQTALRDARIANLRSARERAEAINFYNIQSRRGTQKLQELLQQFEGKPGSSGYENEPFIVDILKGIIADDERNRIASNQRLRLAPNIAGAVGGVTPAVQQLGQGNFPGNTPNGPPTGKPAGPVVAPQAPTAPGAPPPRVPSGFVVVPPNAQNAGGGTATGPQGQYRQQFDRYRGGAFLDVWIARVDGDP